MSNQYGPWATSINTCGNPQLSTFWRRLTMLVSARQTSPVLSWRNLACLCAAGALMLALPTVRVGEAAAEDEKQAETRENPAPSIVPDKDSAANKRLGDQIHRKSSEEKSPTAEAAQRAYLATAEQYYAGQSDIEAVYRWSCRWMQAERANRGDTAVRSHLDRMTALSAKITMLHNAGAKGGSSADYEAARYYVAEAKEMLDKAKKAEALPTVPGVGTRRSDPFGDEPNKLPRLPALQIDAAAAGAAAIEQFDTDKDGKISGAELDGCPGLKAAVEEIDPSGSGEITAEMIATRIKAWQDSKIARMSIACRVARNGMLLEGAEVKFVPEKFLGGNLKTAVGKTDANGLAMIAIANSLPPGVAPGLYRVEITKPGETVPAKYNTATILGQEVARDAKGLMRGINFNLEY